MIAKRCVIAQSWIIGPCSTGISTSRRTLPSGVDHHIADRGGIAAVIADAVHLAGQRIDMRDGR